MGFVLGVMKIIHYFGLFMGGGSAFGAMVIGMTAPSAPTEHRPTLIAMAKRFKIISHIALALLLATGVLLATFGDVWSRDLPWFWVKLVAVAVLIAGIVMAGRAGARALQGDPRAGARAERFGMLNHAALIVILIAAVMAFH